MGRYVVREDIALADCALDIEGHDLGDLFETAARAVAELMVDPATVAIAVRRDIALSAATVELLLFDWIAELIFLKDSEQLILTETAVAVEAGPPARLLARVAGGPIDRGRTSLRADAKAPTFHRFGIDQIPGGWRARVVIDI